MEQTTNQLTYKRRAYKAKDGQNGVLYLHRWGTGFQELVFANKEDAAQWAKKTLTELK